MSLNSNQLNLLILLCDMSSALYENIPEKARESADYLISKKLLRFDGRVVYPTNKAQLAVNAAKSMLNFNYILGEMNNKMLINLWHRLIEVSKEKDLFTNVVFRNLSDENLDYMVTELQKAIDFKLESKAIESL